MNKVKVTICGKEFTLRTEELPGYYNNLASKLDSDINSLLKINDGISMLSAAILSALGAYDDLKKANDSIDNIRSQIKEYVDDAGKSRLERDELARENSLLRAKITTLENRLILCGLQDNGENTDDMQITEDKSEIKATEAEEITAAEAQEENQPQEETQAEEAVQPQEEVPAITANNTSNINSSNSAANNVNKNRHKHGRR